MQLIIKEGKCSFLENSCVYLVHRLDADGIHHTTDTLIAL